MAANLNQPPQPPSLESLREAVRDHGEWAEDRAVTRLLHALELTGGARHRAVAIAMALVEGSRARRDERPFLDAFLQEFGLSNQEGIALMCIAEALLRIPDDAHGTTHRQAHQGFAGLAREFAHPSGRVRFDAGIQLENAAGEHQPPGRGIDK